MDKYLDYRDIAAELKQARAAGELGGKDVLELQIRALLSVAYEIDILRRVLEEKGVV